MKPLRQSTERNFIEMHRQAARTVHAAQDRLHDERMAALNACAAETQRWCDELDQLYGMRHEASDAELLTLANDFYREHEERQKELEHHLRSVEWRQQQLGDFWKEMRSPLITVEMHEYLTR